MSEARATARQHGTCDWAAEPVALRVLMVEDSADDAELIICELERGGYRVSCERVETREDLLAKLSESSWDVVLSDYSMPQFSGPDALELVKSRGLDLPFIIVSGAVGEETAVRAMRSGAHDYVLKQSLMRLVPAVERELREAALRAERKKMQDQLIMSDRLVTVGTLAAGVAHELNNPLAALIANLDALARDLARASSNGGLAGATDDLFAELRDARESASRMRHIVGDLKSFSRGSEDVAVPVDVHRVLDSSLRMAHNEIRHRARVVKDYGRVSPVQANEARLGQVFLNLVINAAQSIVEGHPSENQIRVSTCQPSPGRVVIEIGDTGAGIAPEHLPRIFDAFFTTKPSHVGTGLGLSICHRIVSALGGELAVESELGKGSTFRVVLPRAATDAASPAEDAPSSVAASRRGRVLVIDDEPLIATAIRRTLWLEHDVIIAPAAKGALERILRGEQFDVILCDLMMPQMTGMDLYDQLVRTAPNQAERMVFLSGGTATAAVREFLDDVPNQRLEKPFDTRQLVALVNDRTRAN
jgi:signal transduction histidine kinase